MKLVFDEEGKREYETGVSDVALFPTDSKGAYGKGVAWNGVTQIDSSPSGGESQPVYADNIEYLNLTSVEKFGGTINAYAYPDEFAECDGSKNLVEGVDGIQVGQQTRKQFGLVYKTLKGNDIQDTDYGFKLHIVYGAKAAPSAKSHNTVNETPEAATMSWTFNAKPVKIEGMKPTSHLTIDSTKTDEKIMKAIVDKLYGTAEEEPTLLKPTELIELINTTNSAALGV